MSYHHIRHHQSVVDLTGTCFILFTNVLQKSGTDPINGLDLQLEFVQTENEILKSELSSAQEQIAQLKASLASVSNSYTVFIVVININQSIWFVLQTKDDEKSIYERIKEFEFKESELLKEVHELREQNDLLEFRIVELEETHDKVSQ